MWQGLPLLQRTTHDLQAESNTWVLQDIDLLATYNKKREEVEDAAIYVKGNVIEWVGKTSDLPEKYKSASEVISLKDRVVIPGMVRSPSGRQFIYLCQWPCLYAKVDE